MIDPLAQAQGLPLEQMMGQDPMGGLMSPMGMPAPPDPTMMNPELALLVEAQDNLIAECEQYAHD